MRISIVVPTRERAFYLSSTLETCLASDYRDLEVLVLDNMSQDDTAKVVRSIDDNRIVYHRSDRRLSMRDNFERGLGLANGDIIGFIGDDDGVFPDTPDVVAQLFSEYDVSAISADRAHYAWPDLLSARKNTGLLPRGAGEEIRSSRRDLSSLLSSGNYYDLPCLYHGFVKRSVIDRISRRDGRFFNSSQVDMYSSIAISMEDISFLKTRSPLVINGGSSRSNGASHFGGGTKQEAESWKVEDDLGFLPGFADFFSVKSLILESALRYATVRGQSVHDIFDRRSIVNSMYEEKAGRLSRDRGLDTLGAALSALGVSDVELAGRPGGGRVSRLLSSFVGMQPIDMISHGVNDVSGAARFMAARRKNGETGVLDHLFEQLRVSIRLALG